MKYILALTLIISVTSAAVLTDEDKIKLKKFSDTCVAQTHVSEKVLEKMRVNQIEDDPRLKEYIYCIFQKLGLQNSDGTIIKDNVLSFASKDPIAEKAMKPCIDKHGSTGPETAFSMFVCYKLNLPVGFKTTL
nr:B1 protein-like [Onthophagus taurus]